MGPLKDKNLFLQQKCEILQLPLIIIIILKKNNNNNGNSSVVGIVVVVVLFATPKCCLNYTLTLYFLFLQIHRVHLFAWPKMIGTCISTHHGVSTAGFAN